VLSHPSPVPPGRWGDVEGARGGGSCLGRLVLPKGRSRGTAGTGTRGGNDWAGRSARHVGLRQVTRTFRWTSTGQGSARGRVEPTEQARDRSLRLARSCGRRVRRNAGVGTVSLLVMPSSEFLACWAVGRPARSVPCGGISCFAGLHGARLLRVGEVPYDRKSKYTVGSWSRTRHRRRDAHAEEGILHGPRSSRPSLAGGRR